MPVPRKTSWSRLSLTTKGLILLSIPLCLQLGFGLVLVQLEQEEEVEAMRAEEARSVATQVHSLLWDLVRISTISTMPKAQWQFQGYQTYSSQQYTTILRKIQKKYERLEELTANEPSLSLVVKRSFKPIDQAIKIIDGVRTDIAAGHQDKVFAASGDISDRLTVLAHDFLSQELLLMAKNEEADADSCGERQSKLRHATLTCTLAVILTNILFGVFLAKILVHTIIARLRLIADNAVKLASHQPLHQPLAGEDEIAQLDQVFHSMANTIERSARAKQDLYNMVTHDLRTPLAAIMGCLEMLSFAEAEGLKPGSKKLINTAVRNSTRTMGLVNDLLDSQKLEAGMLELNAAVVHLEDVFENVELEIAGWLEESGIEVSFPSTDAQVKANRDMLGRVIFNLIANALKQAPRGSLISIGVNSVAAMAEITISDQGAGLPKHMLKDVFVRHSLKALALNTPAVDEDARPDSPGGSGLGLSICRDFVDLHGGKIWATSNLGHGTTLHFTVPLA